LSQKILIIKKVPENYQQTFSYGNERVDETIGEICEGILIGHYPYGDTTQEMETHVVPK